MAVTYKQKSGFTLVELIVVITILAILATIAFLSFQGYSADARDSKRASDIASITRKIGLLDLQGSPMLAFATDNSSRLSGAQFAGVAANAGVNYEAGIINFTALGMKDADYADPVNGKYRIGITTVAGSYYELAATLEKGGTKEALVIGKYKQRTAANNSSALVTSTNGSADVTLTNVDIGKFRKGDTLKDYCNLLSPTVKKVSMSGLVITLSGNCDGTAGTLSLKLDESAGLIADKTTNTTAVTN